jgi:7-carboxy-7-deazaguanine synthase
MMVTRPSKNQTHQLRLFSIYLSVDGEVTHQGPLHWTVVVRCGGCNLRCWRSTGHCDAPGTLDVNYEGYTPLSTNQVFYKVREHEPCHRVLITGGEPLMQKPAVVELASMLDSHAYVVTLETSGSLDMTPAEMSPFTSIIADIKPPSTEMHHRNNPDLHNRLRPRDYLKVVIQDRADFDWALDYLSRLDCLRSGQPGQRSPQVAFGPRWGYIEGRQIMHWLHEQRRYDIMLNLQLHKVLFEEAVTPPTPDLKGLYRDEARLRDLVQLER